MRIAATPPPTRRANHAIQRNQRHRTAEARPPRSRRAVLANFEGEDAAEKQVELARKICMELAIHARIEEELFYPAAREELPEDEQTMVAEAAVEHASLKMLIGEIDGTGPDDPLFDARMTVLQEYVKHHVKEEEQELMPAVEKAGEVDLDQLGRATRRAQAAAEGQAARTGLRRRRTARSSWRNCRPRRRVHGRHRWNGASPLPRRASAQVRAHRHARASRPARNDQGDEKRLGRRQSRRDRQAQQHDATQHDRAPRASLRPWLARSICRVPHRGHASA